MRELADLWVLSRTAEDSQTCDLREAKGASSRIKIQFIEFCRIKIQLIEFLCENSQILSPPPHGGGLTNLRLYAKGGSEL